MTIAAVDLGGANGYGQSPTSVSDIHTPNEDDIICAAVIDWDGVTGFSAANWNITFSEIGSPLVISSGYLSLWAGRVGASPSSDQLDMTTTASDENYCVAVFKLTGMDDVAAIASLFVQSRSDYTYDAGGTNPNAIGTAFSAFGDALNGVLTICASFNAIGNTYTPQSGFTSIAAHSGNSGAIDVHLRASNELNPTYSVDQRYTQDGARAFELYALTAGSSGSLPLLKPGLPNYLLAR